MAKVERRKPIGLYFGKLSKYTVIQVRDIEALLQFVSINTSYDTIDIRYKKRY